MPPEKPNVTTNLLPPHNRAPPPKHVNFIQTGVMSYDPIIYITPSHLSKPEVFLPDSTDLCMLDISETQPEPMVVAVNDRIGMISEESGTVDSGTEELGSFVEEVYNPSGYITTVGQARPNVELPVGAEICAIREKGLDPGMDDLAAPEGDLATFSISMNKIRETRQSTGLILRSQWRLQGGLTTNQILLKNQEFHSGSGHFEYKRC